MYLAQNNDMRGYQSCMIISNRSDEVPQQPWLDTFLTQAAPRQVQDVCVCVCVCALRTHTFICPLIRAAHTYIHREEKGKKKGRKHQIKPSLSNPLTRVIKDAHGLLCEALSPKSKASKCRAAFTLVWVLEHSAHQVVFWQKKKKKT